MSEELARICGNCNIFYPLSFESGEHGICLADTAFEPYLDEILEQDDFSRCRELAVEKMFPDEQEPCDRYEEVEVCECTTDELSSLIDGWGKKNLKNEISEKTGHIYLFCGTEYS